MIDQIHPLYGMNEAQSLKDLVLSGSWLTEHEVTKKFEKKIAKFLGVKHCIATTSGTMALMIACKVAGLKKDDLVLVPSMTMVATAYAPMMLDCDIEIVPVNSLGCMSTLMVNGLEPEAVIYVSLNGRADRLNELKIWCEANKVVLIEDACQSLGSKHKGKYLGTFGDIGCFSLSPHKIISTGQGGLLVTNSDEYAKRIRMFKDFGREKGGVDVHNSFGINAKYTDLQATVGIEQFKDIDNRIKRKKEIYDRYYLRLEEYIIKRLDETVPWMVDGRFPDRCNLHAHLLKQGIKARALYPPLYIQGGLEQKMYDYNAEFISDYGLWLPSSLDIHDEEIDAICRIIRNFLGTEE